MSTAGAKTTGKSGLKSLLKSAGRLWDTWAGPKDRSIHKAIRAKTKANIRREVQQLES